MGDSMTPFGRRHTIVTKHRPPSHGPDLGETRFIKLTPAKVQGL